MLDLHFSKDADANETASILHGMVFVSPSRTKENGEKIN